MSSSDEILQELLRLENKVFGIETTPTLKRALSMLWFEAFPEHPEKEPENVILNEPMRECLKLNAEEARQDGTEVHFWIDRDRHSGAQITEFENFLEPLGVTLRDINEIENVKKYPQNPPQPSKNRTHPAFWQIINCLKTEIILHQLTGGETEHAVFCDINQTYPQKAFSYKEKPFIGRLHSIIENQVFGASKHCLLALREFHNEMVDKCFNNPKKTHWGYLQERYVKNYLNKDFAIYYIGKRDNPASHFSKSDEATHLKLEDSPFNRKASVPVAKPVTVDTAIDADNLGLE